MSFQSLYDGEDGDSFTGEEAENALAKFRPDRGNEQLVPYFQRVKENFPKVCPYFQSLKPDLPRVTQQPETPTITYRRGASRAQIASLTKEAQDRWSQQWKDWSTSHDANFKARSEWLNRILAEAEDCVCRAMVDERHNQAAICPNSKGYSPPTK